MKNNTLLIKLLTVLFGFILIAVSAFSWYFIPVMTGKSADDILRIEVKCTSNYLFEEAEYIVDFTDNSLVRSYNDEEPVYSSFSEKNKRNFIKSANFYGFFDWEEYYDTDIYDLSSVDINIIYTDGSEQSIYCYGGTAPNYEQMRSAFNDNFGFRLW